MLLFDSFEGFRVCAYRSLAQIQRMHDIVLVSIMTGDTSVSKAPRLGLIEVGVAGGSRSSCELLQMMIEWDGGCGSGSERGAYDFGGSAAAVPAQHTMISIDLFLH